MRITRAPIIYKYIILLVLRVERHKILDKEDKESMAWRLSYNYVYKSIEKSRELCNTI